VTARVAFVTGAGRNLGRAVCRSLAADGLDIVANVRAPAPGDEQLVAEIEQLGARCVVVAGDVGRPADVSRMFDEAERHYGRLDVLVNSAAERRWAPFLDLEEQVWRRTMDVCLGGAIACSQRALAVMVRQRSGSIVNVSGLIANEGLSGGAHISAAKAALLGLTRGLAAEFGELGIRVNAVLPSSMDTVPAGGVTDERLRAERLRRAAGNTALARIARLDEVADVIAFLASDQASYITGQSIHVNGGRLMA
jgi:3-oxoacyl-[acyl-carrier protein] reductase